MKTYLLLACLAAMTATVLADPYTQAIKQSKRVVNQVGQRQAETQGAAPVASQPPPQPVAPPPNPALVALQLNISNLAKDLGDLQADPTKKQPLINDLNLAVQGTSPAQASVTKLTEDLALALTGKTLPLEQRTKFAQYLRAIFNSSHVSPTQQRTIFEDARKIFQTGGVTTENADKIIGDLKTVAGETK